MGTGVKGNFGNTYGARQSMKGTEGVSYFGDLFDLDYDEYDRSSGVNKSADATKDGYIIVRLIDRKDEQLYVPELFVNDIFSAKNNGDKLVQGFSKDFQQKTRVFSNHNEFVTLNDCREYYNDATNHINGAFKYPKSNWYVEQIVLLLKRAIEGNYVVEAKFFKPNISKKGKQVV